MSWLIPAPAALLVIASLGATRYLLRKGPSVEGISTGDMEAAAEGKETDPRVQQFRLTGSNRLIEPPSAPSDLRPEAQAKLEKADLASDLATLDAYLADVRDSIGGDEAIFWRWSEHRDTLTPTAWSTPGVKRPAHFDMNAWRGLVQWAAEGRVM